MLRPMQHCTRYTCKANRVSVLGQPKTPPTHHPLKLPGGHLSRIKVHINSTLHRKKQTVSKKSDCLSSFRAAFHSSSIASPSKMVRRFGRPLPPVWLYDDDCSSRFAFSSSSGRRDPNIVGSTIRFTWTSPCSCFPFFPFFFFALSPGSP